MADLIDFVKLLTLWSRSSQRSSDFPRHSSNVRCNEKGVAAAKALTP